MELHSQVCARGGFVINCYQSTVCSDLCTETTKESFLVLQLYHDGGGDSGT